MKLDASEVTYPLTAHTTAPSTTATSVVASRRVRREKRKPSQETVAAVVTDVEIDEIALGSYIPAYLENFYDF